MATISNDTKSKKGIKQFLKDNLYFLLIGVLVVGVSTALVVAAVNSNNKIDPGEETNTEQLIPVLPMLNATIGKEYIDYTLLWNGTLGQYEAHKAIKFIAGDDLNVYSILDGTVVSVTTTLGEGTKIVIEHAEGYKSVYMALEANAPVTVGQKVTGGQVIGTAADTAGYEVMNAAHVHFELYKNGNKINPGLLLNLGDK